MLSSPIWIFSFIHGKRPLYVIQSLDLIPSVIVVAWSWVVSFGSAVDTETFWMSLQTSQRKAYITSSASDPQLGETGPSTLHAQPWAFCTAHSCLDPFLLKPWLSILEQFFWYFFQKISPNIRVFRNVFPITVVGAFGILT